jgi:ring-1,2-phenylacetyl-CoA epoxidase subunit PaaC
VSAEPAVRVGPLALPATGPAAGSTAIGTYALRLGDDALVLSHRLGEWISNAPAIEEDIALGNLALDLLGQARSLLTYAGDLEGAGRTEDDLAYLRPEREFSNLQITELPNGDFAVTMARQLVFSTYQELLYEQLSRSSDQTLAGIAGKAVKEVAYHRDHAAKWVVRLGDGTEESHRRMQDGLAVVWPYVDEVFQTDDLERSLVAEGVAVESAGLRAAWAESIGLVLDQATLEEPTVRWTARGGRRGIHTEALGYLLAEMQHLHRSHPGATW